MLCDVMSCYVMSCHAMWCHVMLCDVMSCYVMSCHAMSCNCTVLYFAVLHYIALYCNVTSSADDLHAQQFYILTTFNSRSSDRSMPGQELKQHKHQGWEHFHGLIFSSIANFISTSSQLRCSCLTYDRSDILPFQLIWSTRLTTISNFSPIRRGEMPLERPHRRSYEG